MVCCDRRTRYILRFFAIERIANNARFIAYNSPKTVRTRWGSLSAPKDPLAAIGGLLLRGGDRKGGDGRERWEREGSGMEGRGGEERGRKGNQDPLWMWAGYGPVYIKQFMNFVSKHPTDPPLLFTSDKGGGMCFCPHAGARMFACLSVCVFVCLSVCKITQKRVHGFGCNVACLQMSGHGRTD